MYFLFSKHFKINLKNLKTLKTINFTDTKKRRIFFFIASRLLNFNKNETLNN